MEERKFTDEELYNITQTDLVYPDNYKELRKNLHDYFIKLGVEVDDHGFLLDDQANNVVPEEYWFEACDLVIHLAYALLRERDDAFNDLNSEIDDIERSVKQLKRILNGRTSN